MTPAAVLEAIRDRYLSRFREAVREARAVRGARVVLEGAFCRADGSLAREGPLELPLRVDIVAVPPEGPPDRILVDVPPPPVPPVSYVRNALPIDVAPFRWNACGVRVEGLPAEPSWTPLVEWFARWFDEKDRRTPGPDGLSGVAHFLSDPAAVAGEWRFEVDFGSAPVRAFEDLIERLERMGARRVGIAEETSE